MELKFRAWHKEKKCWEIDFVVSHNGFPLFVRDIKERVGKDPSIEEYGTYEIDVSDWSAVERLEITRFIGSKDRNNKEIYEGDIRREEIEFEDGDEIHYYVCVWINEWSMFAWLSATDGEYQKYLREGAESLDTTSYWTYPTNDGDRQDIVVCGNIFEHPHLLEHTLFGR
jgi:uncharacterized phage protein (TIGR01671 family)